MGFPVGYADFFLPKLILHILSLLYFIRRFIFRLFRFLGIPDFVEFDVTSPEQPTPRSEFQSISAVLLRDCLPIVKFRDLICDGEGDTPESCAVCLYEFEGEEEIRRLTNCPHIFHRSCLDRWMDHDQKTCPLCRSPFIPDEKLRAFNERLRAASAVPDFLHEYPWIPGL